MNQNQNASGNFVETHVCAVCGCLLTMKTEEWETAGWILRVKWNNYCSRSTCHARGVRAFRVLMRTRHCLNAVVHPITVVRPVALAAGATGLVFEV